jgi:N-hydroxyarylamine O-acetyltransferase
MVVGSEGAGPPANHRTHVVSLDQRYVVDVGLGVPTMRRPLPLGGSTREDDTGVAWRVVESDRPDADYATEYRGPGDDEWSLRYVFRDVERESWFFEPTCEYLATAPESPFVGDPIASIATENGHVKVEPGALVRTEGSEEYEESLDGDDWYDALEREVGIDYRPA